MERLGLIFLNNWLKSTDRKPLVIRGARQVGKTWLVRHFAQINKKNLIEINFEKRPQLANLFSSNDPKEILLNLSSIFENIDSENKILFLDEIQAAPEILARLRWFAEDMPDLPIIATGSLLEFVLSEHKFSMPVGRINYMHLEPLSFIEFLLALSRNNLVEYLKQYTLDKKIPDIIHEELLSLFKEYIIVGGMPQSVNNWVNTKSLKKINQVHQDLLATYRDDFSKYSGRLSAERLDEVMTSVPFFLGKKFTYSKINPEVKSLSIKQSLNMLFKSKVCHKVSATAANGLPLSAEAQEKYLKVIFIDVGLCSSSLGLSLDQINLVSQVELINKGNISEQIVGQILRTNSPFYIEPSLFYWQRSEKQSNAEIDYIIQHKNRIIPIEVKTGSTGSLKSLHIFMQSKKLPLAVRINSDIPTKTDVSVKDHEGNLIEYKLLSLPFYLLSELHRLLDS